jgi:outer membrane protein
LLSLYSNPRVQQTLSIGVSLPILDWGRNRNKVNLAKSNLKTVLYTIEQEKLIIKEEVTNLFENQSLIKESITTAKKTDSLANERYNLSNEQYKFGKVTMTELNISLQEKDNAKRAYLLMLRDFWASYYRLRMFTNSQK